MSGEDAPGEPRPELLDADDLEAVAELHLAAFPTSELSRLGRDTVAAYYRGLVEGPSEVVVIGVRRPGGLQGFLFGGTFRGATIGFLEQQRWLLARRVLRQPSVVVRSSGRQAIGLAVGLVVRRLRGVEPERPSEIPPGSFGILSVAVHPDQRRSGLGSLLLADAEARARADGFTSMHLTVDRTDSGAQAFYERAGWRSLGSPVHRGGLLYGKSLLDDA